MANKVDTSNIDADFIISSFESNSAAKESAPPIVPTTLVMKDDTRKKKSKSNVADYHHLFIKEADCVARFGKQIFIRQEYHDRIQRITQRVGKNEVSLFSYVDNVLAHHFETFQEEITEAYNQNNPPIF